MNTTAASTTPIIPSTLPTKTSVRIPCCLCGTLILPNAANQCPACLSQNFNLQSILQRGPGNADYVTIHQCRKCRKFQKSEHKYEACDMESPELLALCLKQIPALQTVSGNTHTLYSKIQLVDANFIWTEPHSMRLKLHLTVRTIVQGVTLQQRVQTWMKIQFSQCPDCNREYTHRTWQAIVQVRQKRNTTHASTNTLALLEMALAKNQLLRQDVLQIDSVSQGFDFYFLSYRKAQLFASGLQRILPCRLSTTRKMVSEDVTNNTANMKYTLLMELVPLCRHDLVLVDKTASKSGGGPLTGRLALVQKLGAGAIHCVDASPSRQLKHTSLSVEAISQESYYKQEKAYHVLQSHQQLVTFIVLDVELWNQAEEWRRGDVTKDDSTATYKRLALADVQVVRADGAGDDILTTVSHLGLLLQPGDMVLGYDLSQSTAIQHDDLLQRALQSHVVVPDVVLVKKVKTRAAAAMMQQEDDDDGTIVTRKSSKTATTAMAGTKPRLSKAKERRRRRDQGKKMVELEESAMRMGLLSDGPVPAHHDGDDENDDGVEWDEELSELERDLAAIDMGSVSDAFVEEEAADADDFVMVETIEPEATGADNVANTAAK